MYTRQDRRRPRRGFRERVQTLPEVGFLPQKSNVRQGENPKDRADSEADKRVLKNGGIE